MIRFAAFAILAFAAATAPSGAEDSDAFPKLGVVARIPGPDGFWDYASINPASNMLYVGRGDGVLAVDLATKTIKPQFVPGNRVHGVLATGNLEASANGASNTVTLFDPSTGKVAADVSAGEGLDSLAYDASANVLVALDGKGKTATFIDAASQSASGSVPIGGDPEFGQADGHGLVFDNVEDKNEIAVIDVKGHTIARRYSLQGCDGPGGLAYDAADRLVMSACHNGVVTVVNADTGQEVASVPIGEGPDAVIFDSARRLFYVPCGRSGTLSVISVAGPDKIALVETVPTQVGARTGAVDLKTGLVYLPTAKFQPSTEPGKRPAMVPGTFEILVVGPTQ